MISFHCYGKCCHSLFGLLGVWCPMSSSSFNTGNSHLASLLTTASRSLAARFALPSDQTVTQHCRLLNFRWLKPTMSSYVQRVSGVPLCHHSGSVKAPLLLWSSLLFLLLCSSEALRPLLQKPQVSISAPPDS